MCNFKGLLLFFCIFCLKGSFANINETTDWTSPRIYVSWPNGIIPFYINPEHFDHFQSLTIMTTITTFAYKTCLKFAPALTPPKDGQHVLLFENPKGVRKCLIDDEGHPKNDPSRLIVGYDCLKSPELDMLIMKELGFPFEHNRAIRDNYVTVLFENIEPHAIEFFTKDSEMPVILSSLPYDINSVMHFGERDFSKNGHRTIMFKDTLQIRQQRSSLTATDLKKIEIVYGPECRARDRQEKIELCQNYPGTARRKREAAEVPEDTNLRVNRDITPPPEKTKKIKELGIEEEIQKAIDQLYQVSGKALTNARGKVCNKTEDTTKSENKDNKKTELADVIQSITEFAENMVSKALTNLTEFCAASESMEVYQRSHLQKCGFYYGRPCPETYRSTKSGNVRYSTQHRPLIYQSTKNYGSAHAIKHYANFRATDDNSTDVKPETPNESSKVKTEVNDDKVNKNGRRDDHLDDAHERRRRGVENSEKAVKVKDTKELDIKVKEMENIKVSSVKSRRATDVPKKDLKYAHRRRFHPTRSSKEHIWDDSNISVEKGTTKRKSVRYRSDSEDKNDNKRYDDDRDDDKRDDDDRNDDMEKGTTKRKSVRYRSDSEDRNDNKRDDDDRDNDDRDKDDRDNDDDRDDDDSHDERPKKKRFNYGLRQKQTTPSSDENPRGSSSPHRVVELSKANEEFYNERKWPEGKVRYMVQDDPNYDSNEVKQRLEEVNAILKKKTCVQLEEIKESDVDEDTDYLVIDTSADYVTGRVGGKQNFGSLELFRGGQHRQHAAMMVMAMLGFYFEVARHDRDKHIRVHLRHVRPDKLHHFEKIRSDGTLPLPYDYESATHPAWQFWRQLGKKGISTVATYKTKDPDGSIMKKLGQNSKLLSDTDIIKINSVYGIDCFKPVGRSRHINKKKFIKNRDRYF